ncbi:SAM-dependent methyltransferase [Rhodoblastus acidophilus]|uniref:class I SAM-dependent methyltransferase n=1 Tax=Rhodoblastus acidophilus TaxID=1074 RepID=UPI0022257A87|nr:class I SAM-dependent methyltransferase [Rhodoblastus acidophilus]MCW2315388.1 SAM-dependent methyltransferase [Rhodoblastus acidophilus]
MANPKHFNLLPNIEAVSARHAPDTARYYECIQGPPVIDAYVESLRNVIYGEDYLEFHKRRWDEILRYVRHFATVRPQPKILEIGMSTLLRCYKDVAPGAIVHTVDRPRALGGQSAESASAVGSDGHFNLDLNSDSFDVLAGEARKYDLIIMTEVVEHILATPAELIAELLPHLAPGGRFYLTTPNVLRLASLMKMCEEGRTAQNFFSKIEGNTWGHWHYREYTMNELVDEIRKAGATPDMAAFSDCWDSDHEIFRELIATRGNLVAIFGK